MQDDASSNDSPPEIEAPPVSDTARETTPPFIVPGVGFTEQDARRIAETTLEYGWYSPEDRRMVAIDGAIGWDDPGAGAATRLSLHSWEPLDALLAAHSLDGDAAFLDAAHRYARAWLASGTDTSGPDLGTAGRRALRLAYLAGATEDPGLVTAAADHATTLSAGIDPTAVDLATTDAIVGVAALVDRLTSIGADRRSIDVDELLDTHLDAVFTRDGIHRSQSPGTQRAVLERLLVLIDGGLVSPEVIGEWRTRAEHALAWFVTPDGSLANFGDTQSDRVSGAFDPSPSGVRFLPDRIADATYLHAASAGRFGRAPDAHRKVFHEGGFMAIKEPWPTRTSESATSHLVVRTGPPAGGAGADIGLALTWHDAGRALIVEPGPPTEPGTHPADGYALRPEAHNRVVIGPEVASTDLTSVPVALTGGLQRWGLLEGHYFCDSYEEAGDLRHRRSLLFEPGSWLIVADVIDTAVGRSVGPRFHAAEDLGLLQSGRGFTLLSGPDPMGWAQPLDAMSAPLAARGEIEPVPAGWWSPDGVRMVPNWSFGWEAEGPATFVTLLAIDARPEPDPPAGPWFGWHTTTYRARVAVTEWGIVDIDIQRTEEEGA